MSNPWDDNYGTGIESQNSTEYIVESMLNAAIEQSLVDNTPHEQPNKCEPHSRGEEEIAIERSLANFQSLPRRRGYSNHTSRTEAHRRRRRTPTAFSSTSRRRPSTSSISRQRRWWRRRVNSHLQGHSTSAKDTWKRPSAPDAKLPAVVWRAQDIDTWVGSNGMGPEPVVQCFGCRDELVVPGMQEDDGQREVRLVLGCGHVVGSDCLTVWMGQAGERGLDARCPCCSEVIVTGVL